MGKYNMHLKQRLDERLREWASGGFEAQINTRSKKEVVFALEGYLSFCTSLSLWERQATKVSLDIVAATTTAAAFPFLYNWCSVPMTH